MPEKDRPLLPCSNCGAELFHAEGVMTEVELDFEFQGEKATRELPGKKCPECGEVTAL